VYEWRFAAPSAARLTGRLRVQRHRQEVETPQRPEQLAREFRKLGLAFWGGLS
jgi:hypothetical protein